MFEKLCVEKDLINLIRKRKKIHWWWIPTSLDNNIPKKEIIFAIIIWNSIYVSITNLWPILSEGIIDKYVLTYIFDSWIFYKSFFVQRNKNISWKSFKSTVVVWKPDNKLEWSLLCEIVQRWYMAICDDWWYYSC